MLDFKKKIISDKEQKLVKAEIFNPSNRVIAWSIVESSGRDGTAYQPFRLEPMNGELAPLSKATISAYFSPQEPANYGSTFKILVDGSGNSDS